MKKYPFAESSKVFCERMISLPLPSLSAALGCLCAGLFWAGISPNLHAQQGAGEAATSTGEVIIDTNFSQAESDGRISVEPPVYLPQTTPNGISTSPESSDGEATASTVTIGTESIGDLEPPFAMIEVAPDFGGSPSVKIDWFLLPLQLDAGVFDLSFDALALQGDKEAWVEMIFEGPENPGDPIHPTQMPALVRFGGERRENLILPGGFPSSHGDGISTPYHAEEPLHFEMMVDLNRMVWSLAVNGDELQPETPMPDYFENGLVRIHSIVFRTSDPDARFALSKVRLIRRSE